MTLRPFNYFKKALNVYFISGTNNVKKSLPQVLEEAISGGVSLFQFREKGETALSGEAKKTMAKTLMQICQEHKIPFIMNDDVELALLLDADGVHVGQKDANAKNVREQIGPDKILGVSAHTLDEAKKAIEDGANYIGVGPMFATTSKADAEDVCGPEMIAHIRKQGIDIPIVAIGGITVHRTRDIIHAGADGVALISAIASASSPKKAAEQCCKECEITQN
jgi:thiamine-phosphate pyrophosphorylase